MTAQRLRLRRASAAIATVVMLVSLLVVAPALPVSAQEQCGSDVVTRPVLTASPSGLPANGPTTVTVTGSSYLVPKHLCSANIRGGVYVFFGWVNPAGNWGPSTRANAPGAGKFGTGYTYPGESGGAETREVSADVPIRFVSFSPGGESGSSTPFHMDGAGNWSTQLVVNGSTYSWSGEGVGSGSVDCRSVQCGIFTIGAHGITSATNEVFTPITFAAPAPAAAGGSGGGSSANTGSGAAAGSGGSTGGGGSVGPTGGSGSARDPGVGSGSSDGATDGGTATTVAPDTSIGSTPTTTATTEATSTASRSTAVDGERASSVQDFGGGGGSSTAPLLGVFLGVLLAGGVGAVVVVRRRNRASRGGGGPTAPAAS